MDEPVTSPDRNTFSNSVSYLFWGFNIYSPLKPLTDILGNLGFLPTATKTASSGYFSPVSNSITLFSKDTTVVVKDKIKNSDPTYYYLKDFIEKYKTDDTIVGIDVSSWQGNINWKKVKESGIDAAMIRIAYGSRNKSTIDKKFKQNLKNAKEAGIKVGIYYYSYAKDTSEAINQAKWIINELNGEKLDLPIAFDWEDWSDFMSYKINFNDLN